MKETKEVLVAVNDLALELVNVFKDGVQLSDVTALLTHISSNEAVKASLYAAYENISKVPAEVKEITLEDGLELASVQLGFIPKFVTALKA